MSQSKKIVLVPSAYYPSFGGVEEIARNVARRLQAAGHAVTIVVHRHPESLPQREIIDGVAVNRFRFMYPARNLRTALSSLKGGMALAGLASLFKQIKPDLVHVICPSTSSLYVWLACKILNIPIVTTLQGELFMDADAIYERSSFARWAVNRLLEGSRHLTACSMFTLQHAEKMFDLRAIPRSVIFNGVDLAESEESVNETKSEPFVFAIGRLVQNKGFDTLVNSFSAVVQVKPDAKLFIAGDGAARGDLEKLVKELGLSGSITFLGKIDRPQVTWYFNHCEFFVLPSPCEPFGIVCLEAMRAGKAQVATRNGGPPEFIQDGIEGLLVPPNDPPNMAAALLRLWSDTSARATMGAAALEQVGKFDWSIITQQYMTLYDAVSG